MEISKIEGEISLKGLEGFIEDSGGKSYWILCNDNRAGYVRKND